MCRVNFLFKITDVASISLCGTASVAPPPQNVLCHSAVRSDSNDHSFFVFRVRQAILHGVLVPNHEAPTAL